MILYIDSSGKEKFILGLSCLSPACRQGRADRYDNKLVFKSIKSPIGTMSEKFLPVLDKFLKSNQTSIKHLTSIIVFQGPGSYTSLRIGISIANTLAWSLNIPAYSVKNKINKKIIGKLKSQLQSHEYFDKPIKPYYQQEIY